MAKTVLVVDDHPVVRTGMAAMLRPERWVARVLEAGSVAEARRLATEQRPDVAVVDLRLPDGDGAALVRDLRVIAPACALLVVTMTNTEAGVRAALAAGAQGYLLKDAAPEVLLAAIVTVSAGGRVVGAGVEDGTTRPANRPPAPFDQLTPRELDLVTRLAGGMGNREIAGQLALSEKTVRNQIAIITSKLGVRDRIEAVLLSHRTGLVPRRR